jgi:hypothetical protein
VLQGVTHRTAGLSHSTYSLRRYAIREGTAFTNMCRAAGYLRCSWLTCRASCCFFLCSKCHNARTQLQIYSRTAKRLTFLQKLRNCVNTVWCSHCGSVLCGPSRSYSVKHEARLSTAVSSSPIPPSFKSSEPQNQAPFSAATAITFHNCTAAININSTPRPAVRKLF